MDSQDSLRAGDNVLLGWHAREWIDHERGAVWWSVASVLFILAVVISLINEVYSAAFAFAALGGLLWVLSHHPAPIVQVSITEMGVQFGERFWQYANIKQFWIIHEKGLSQLHLEVREGRWSKEFAIQLEDVNPLDVRDELARQIPEAEGKEEGLIDFLARTLKL
jgi:hypothetical protein